MALHFASAILEQSDAAEDIVLEAFIKTWGRLDKINDENHATNFLILNIRHRCINEIDARDRRRRLANQTFDPDGVDYNLCEIRALIASRLYDKFSGFIEKCSPRQKEIFNLFDKGYPNAQIADKLSISSSNVWDAKNTVYKKFKKTLTSEDQL